MNSNLGNQFSSVLNDQQKSAIQSYTWIGDKSKWKDIASDLAKGNKPKAEKGISSKEKPLTLRKILDKAIAENNEPLAIATLAQIFAKKK
mgnify:CR=1 FL=1